MPLPDSTDCGCAAGEEPADDGGCRACGLSFIKTAPGDKLCSPCAGANRVTTSVGSKSSDDCVCKAGMVPLPTSTDGSCGCPAGKEEQEDGTCSACGISFYKDTPGDAMCSPCATTRVTNGTGSTSASDCICPPPKVPDDNGDCVCDAGFKFNSDGTCQRCAPGSHKSERGNGPCEPCFNGASCGGDGSAYALEALPLDDGWWRLSPSSKVAYRCPLYGTCPNSTVRAGVEGEGCRTGHRGPLCAACEAGWSIYNGICEQCTEEVRGRSIAVIVVFFLVVAVAVAAAAAWKVRTMLKQRKQADGDGASGDEAQSPSSEGLAASKTVDARQLSRRAAQVAAWAQQRYANSLKVKVSLTVAFLQILGIFGLCFQVDWPDEYEVVVRDVNALMNLNPIGPVSAACVFPGFRWTWHHTLLLKTAGTTAAVVALELGAFVLRRANKKALAANVAQASNALIFYMYPSIVLMLFTAFVPRRFEGGDDGNTTAADEYFLAADISIPYYGETHSGYQVYSAFMILLWPLGVPLYMVRMFFRNRVGVLALARAQIQEKHKLKLHRIERATSRSERESSAPELTSGDSKELDRKAEKAEQDLLRAERQESAAAAEASLKDKEWITDKIKQYEPRVFYFDIIECLRKLAVAGLSAFFPPGSFEKLAFGVIVTSFFLVITACLRPCAAADPRPFQRAPVRPHAHSQVSQRHRRRPRDRLPGGAAAHARARLPAQGRVIHESSGGVRDLRGAGGQGAPRVLRRAPRPRRSLRRARLWRHPRAEAPHRAQRHLVIGALQGCDAPRTPLKQTSHDDGSLVHGNVPLLDV